MTALEISRLDDKMLSMADSRSPKEISQALGGVITPTRVAARIKELLESRDWLTEAQQDQMVSMKMRKVLARLEENSQNFITDDNAKVQLAYLKAIGDRLDKRRAATEVDLERYSQNVGRQLGRVVDETLTYMRGALREQINPDEWDDLVQEAMQIAWQRIEEKQIEPA